MNKWNFNSSKKSLGFINKTYSCAWNGTNSTWNQNIIMQYSLCFYNKVFEPIFVLFYCSSIFISCETSGSFCCNIVDVSFRIEETPLTSNVSEVQPRTSESHRRCAVENPPTPLSLVLNDLIYSQYVYCMWIKFHFDKSNIYFVSILWWSLVSKRILTFTI